MVVQGLTPSDQCEAGEGLRLKLERKVEVLSTVSRVSVTDSRSRTWTIA